MTTPGEGSDKATPKRKGKARLTEPRPNGEALGWHGQLHPLRDMLDALPWDGRERLSTWLTDYLGVPSPTTAKP